MISEKLFKSATQDFFLSIIIIVIFDNFFVRWYDPANHKTFIILKMLFSAGVVNKKVCLDKFYFQCDFSSSLASCCFLHRE